MEAPAGISRKCCLAAFADDTLIEEPTNRDDLIIRKCPTCGAKHYEASGDPFSIGVEAKEIG